MTADATIHSLVFNSSSISPTLDLGGNTLNLVSGGAIAARSGAKLINGTLTAGGNSPSAELFLRNFGTVSANISDNAAGGTVEMALQEMFWGAYFGMFTDKFGIHWMVNFDKGHQR